MTKYEEKYAALKNWQPAIARRFKGRHETEAPPAPQPSLKVAKEALAEAEKPKGSLSRVKRWKARNPDLSKEREREAAKRYRARKRAERGGK